MILSALVFAVVVPVPTGRAAAAQISFISVAGNWHDPVDNVPGSQPGEPTITNGVPASSINWGVTSGSQSGYDFSRKIPGTQTLPPAPTPFFPLGTFTHRNFPVSDPSLTAVQLDVVLLLDVDGVQTGPLNFTFTFNHVETPNNPTPPATCPYPTPPGEGCTDRVTFVSAPQPTTFKVGGVDYTLSMSFVDGNGNPVAEFLTREGLINTADLVGQFTLPPAAINAPALTVAKSGPATMNVGQWGNFDIDVHNTGSGDAWNTSIRDLLPDGATGGMCDQTPEILSARVFAADGVSPVPGKGALNAGTDYSLGYSPAPDCRLDVTLLTAAGMIGPDERLIIQYRTQLDSNTQDGVALTNVAGAIQWFNDNSNNPSRQVYTRTLTDGTVGTPDNEDAHTVTAALSGYFFEKTVANLRSGMNPAATAAPGDTLRYTLRLRTTNQALSDFTIDDELDALNPSPSFVPGTLALVTYPPGANISATSGTGGAKGTGVVDIRNLNLPAGSQAEIQFDIKLGPSLTNGSIITNQSTARLSAGTVFALSDDPNVNGTASPAVSGDEDPTRVTIVSSPSFVVQKISTDLTGDPNILLAGETLRYTLTVKNVGSQDATGVVMRDAVPANTTYVAGSTTLNGAPVADSAGTSALVNGMLIHSPADPAPGSMPADPSSNPTNVATITFDVMVSPSAASGTVISNQGFVSAPANGIVDQPSDDPGTPIPNDPTLDTVTIVLAPSFVVQKISTDMTGNPNMLLAGETLRYTLTVRNIGNQDATGVVMRDSVPANTTYVAGSTTLNGAPVADSAGTSALVNGMLIHAPADPAPGSMPADASSNPANVATIEFDVLVSPSAAAGTVISNQGFVSAPASGIVDQPSDDPDTPIPNDPTLDTVTIVLSPAFVVQKVSTDLTGDPNILLAGEKLRYTITVRNTGNQDASGVVLRDAVPVNTTYVAGSTTLNGVPLTDSGGTSPLVNGLLIHPPANPAPGVMPFGASSDPANVATITFDVVVDPNVINGTIISNQGFVSAVVNRIVDQPSDDPDTPIANDPTRDIVGNKPLLYAEKKVVLFGDLGSPGVVDPGDVLRYTITVQNSAAIPATGVLLRDSVPANTTYLANSTLLNGLPVGQPDGGVSPLASGINISSSNLTPPLPGSGAGTISSGATAVLQFDLQVNAGTPAGTVISNQAVVESVELPDLLTDGDGNPLTGPEPTVIVVGASQQLSITNQVTVVGGGAALPGAQIEYVVRVVNVAPVPALYAVMTDNLAASQPGQLIYVNGSATLNGSAAGVTFAGSTITADYGANYGPLDPGEAIVLRFRATLGPNLAGGTVVTNTGVVAWNTPVQKASASVSIVVGGIPYVSVLTGSAWHDADFDAVRDSLERALDGWTVELYENGKLVHSATTDAAGVYRIVGVAPNETTGARYELRFRAPGASATTATLGLAASPFTNGLQRISNIIVSSGANLQELNLPIQPNGVIYNSVSRTPVAGETLSLLNAGSGTPLPSNCFDDAAQQGQVTLANGYYKFDINFSDPACPSGGDYLIAVAEPAGTSYTGGYSQIIPPLSVASTAAFPVPACPGSASDAVLSTPLYCEVEPSEFAPGASVPPRSSGTTYYVHLMLNSSQQPGSSQIFNNHIPVDPQLLGLVALSKTTPLLNVTRGQLVPYVLTVNNVAGTMLTDVSVVDSFPAGFSYVAGSALLDGVPTEPSVAGRELRWSGLVVAGTQSRTVRLLLAVGAGVSEGEYVNRAEVVNGVTGGAMSGEATATVRVMPDPTFDCTDVTGKVFNDLNRNGVQDAGEDGLAGVRVVTARGLQATTDPYGRYHITCAVTPNEDRGSNFVMKLDDRTLPSGFRLSTDQLQIKRVTRGKALKFDFGASIHRVVGIDLSDAVFKPGTTEIRVQWQPRLNALLEELHKSPAVLRLSYVADTEDAGLVARRMDSIKRQLTEGWDSAGYGYALTIEPEVFWRRGAPAKRPDVRVKNR